MKEKGYELYAAAGGNKFLLQREGLLEEYEKLGISREQEDRWNREILSDCRNKRKTATGNELSLTFYVPVQIAGHSGDIQLMFIILMDAAELYCQVLGTGKKQEDMFTLMLIAEYILNGCVKYFNDTDSDLIKRIGETLLDMFSELEGHPLTVAEEYCRNTFLAKKLTEEELKKRLKGDKAAVRKFLCKEKDNV